MLTPGAVRMKSPSYCSWKMMIKMPLTSVAAAAHRNHHNARDVSLSRALLRAAPSISAYAGTWTTLKKYSNPIQVIPTKTCDQRDKYESPLREKLSSAAPRTMWENPSSRTPGTQPCDVACHP